MPLVAGFIFCVVQSPISSIAAEPVKIGVNIPMSGDVAQMGNKGKDAVMVAAKKINDAGGIKSLGGAKLELIIADCESKPEVASLETERLITKEKVSAIIGAYLSGLTLPGTTMAEKYQVPWIVWIAMTPEITKRGYKYTFRANEDNEIAMNPQAAFMKYWEKQAGHPVKNYYHIYVNDAMGKTQFSLLKKATSELGINLVDSAPCAPDINDFTPIMLKVKSAKPDALFFWQHEEQAIMLTKAMAEHKINVPLLMSFSVFLNDAVLKAVKDLNEGWFQTGLWNAYMPKVSPWVAELAKDYEAASGRVIDGHAAQALQTVYIVAHALEKAGSRDPKAIRDALATVKVGKEDKAYICGYPIAFGEDGQNKNAFTGVMQTWKGNHYAVFPPEVADPSHKPVWKPTWTWLR